MRQYDVVRVLSVAGEPADRNGWRVNQRTPQVGDTGMIVEILQADGQPDLFVVECSDPDGTTVWLSEFQEFELEPVTVAPQ